LFSYQWNRNGVAILGATAKTYVPTALDAGTTLTVTITGLESGYSAASATSNAVAVLAAPTPD
jgi:formyltetrahydrofolate hydrolase